METIMYKYPKKFNRFSSLDLSDLEIMSKYAD